MKRTEPKRKTPMKRTGISRKPKSPKLKTYPRNHKHWRGKADRELTRLTKGKPCEVCAITRGTCGHHLIEKSRSGIHRHNIIEFVEQEFSSASAAGKSALDRSVNGWTFWILPNGEALDSLRKDG